MFALTTVYTVSANAGWIDVSIENTSQIYDDEATMVDVYYGGIDQQLWTCGQGVTSFYCDDDGVSGTISISEIEGDGITTYTWKLSDGNHIVYDEDIP